jgi:hypothetical protein
VTIAGAGPKYLYCVVRTDMPLQLPQAAGGQPVHTICAGGLAAVVSDVIPGPYPLTQTTAMAHLLTIQEAMRAFTVLPFSFGTVAESQDKVKELLLRYRQEFLDQLGSLEGKAEFGLKALWRDKDQPFREILADRADVRRYRDAISQRPPTETRQDRIELGRMVQEALQARREEETRRILERLQPLAAAVRVNSNTLEQVLLNAAFLLVKDTEHEFGEALSSLDREYQDRLRFRLAGPAPPFNFVHLPISWQ